MSVARMSAVTSYTHVLGCHLGGRDSIFSFVHSSSPDICVLPLMYLDISSNFLCRLPTTLRLIASLFTLRVADNPLESPPTQVNTQLG